MRVGFLAPNVPGVYLYYETAPRLRFGSLEMCFLDYRPPHHTAQVWSLAAQSAIAEIAELVA